MREKRVIDLGCGAGDIAWRCAAAGADYVWAVDKSIRLVNADWMSKSRKVTFSTIDINLWVDEDKDFYPFDFDIAICFSVLPYLSYPTATLQWMHKRFGMSLIECQYDGDGPGFEDIKDDDDMRDLLVDCGWHFVSKIGQTTIKDRDKYRSIWLCQKKTKS